jgi:hypothetical protein
MSNQERPKPEQDPTTGRFLPGNTGNGGRRKGSKNAYAEAFWADLQAEWEIGGRAVIKRVMAEEPAKFLAVAANVLPKDLNVKHESTDAFVNLWSRGDPVMRLLALSVLITLPLLVTVPSANAQTCGVPCQRCAARLGIPLDASGLPMRSMARGRGWEMCLAEERAARDRQRGRTTTR